MFNYRPPRRTENGYIMEMEQISPTTAVVTLFNDKVCTGGYGPLEVGRFIVDMSRRTAYPEDMDRPGSWDLAREVERAIFGRGLGIRIPGSDDTDDDDF